MISPMTFIGKLNEVWEKKYGIFYCWTRDSANIEDLTSTSTRVVSTILKPKGGIVDAGVCKMKVWSFKS
jgi:hypothetical protein